MFYPDYYPEFKCKQGQCRHACCTGWPISLTMQEYFKLVGLVCEPALRERLDLALHISQTPSPAAYAELIPRFDGECRLRAKDGRCALQVVKGEDSLPAVCRLYPRGIHKDICACANICEAIPEMFLKRAEPLELRSAFADVISASFRFIAHTDLERLPALLLRQMRIERDVLSLVRL